MGRAKRVQGDNVELIAVEGSPITLSIGYQLALLGTMIVLCWNVWGLGNP